MKEGKWYNTAKEEWQYGTGYCDEHIRSIEDIKKITELRKLLAEFDAYASTDIEYIGSPFRKRIIKQIESLAA